MRLPPLPHVRMQRQQLRICAFSQHWHERMPEYRVVCGFRAVCRVLRPGCPLATPCVRNQGESIPPKNTAAIQARHPAASLAVRGALPGAQRDATQHVHYRRGRETQGKCRTLRDRGARRVMTPSPPHTRSKRVNALERREDSGEWTRGGGRQESAKGGRGFVRVPSCCLPRRMKPLPCCRTQLESSGIADACVPIRPTHSI